MWLPLFATEITDMTHSVSLFITCSVKRYCLELFLSALKFCLNLLENVHPVGPLFYRTVRTFQLIHTIFHICVLIISLFPRNCL